MCVQNDAAYTVALRLDNPDIPTPNFTRAGSDGVGEKLAIRGP